MDRGELKYTKKIYPAFTKFQVDQVCDTYEQQISQLQEALKITEGIISGKDEFIEQLQEQLNDYRDTIEELKNFNKAYAETINRYEKMHDFENEKDMIEAENEKLKARIRELENRKE